MRIYLERYEAPSGDLAIETQTALADIAAAVSALAGLEQRTGRTKPDVMT